MAKFTNLKDLEAYVQNNLRELMKDSIELENVMADAMHDSVVEFVYGAYKPTQYLNREEWGLSDRRNMIVDDVAIVNGAVKLTFINITEGADNLQGQLLTDTIEDGIGGNWDTEGVWSKAREFVKETANSLRSNPEQMIIAIKKGLKEQGFTVR